MRDRAAETGVPISAGIRDGFALDVLPHGAFRFPVVVDCHEFRLHFTDSRHLPSMWVQLRSAFIHEVGVERTVEATVRVVTALTGARVVEPQASRVDLYADFAGWALSHRDRVGLTTHADLRAHFRAGVEEVETIQVGKSPFLVRMYRKDIEVRERGGFAPVFWDGWTGIVTRVEVQAGAEKLREFRIVSVAEALASRGDLWRHATSAFVELRSPGQGPREAWPVQSEWRAVQSAGDATFPSSGLVPFVMVHGDRLRILRALFGYLSSLGAIDAEADLATLLHTLPRHLAEVARGRSFGAEVARKRLRLPRAVRSNVDSDTASAGPGKEAPWAPDLSQVDTRTDA